MKQPMKKGSFVPKNVPGVGWDGVGWVGHEGVGCGGWVMKGCGGRVGWGVSCRGIHIQLFMSDSNSKNNNS